VPARDHWTAASIQKGALLNALALHLLKTAFTFAGTAAAAAVIFLNLTVPADAELVDRVAAVVNDDIILQSDVNQRLREIQLTLDQQGYPQDQQRRILAEQRPVLLARMIDDTLTDQQVKRFNIQIDDEEVDQTIARIRDVNRMSEEELRRQLDMAGTSYADYRQQIKDRMLRGRLLNWEVKSKIVVTDADVEAYYNANRDIYASATKYDLRHILLRVKPADDPARKAQVKRQMEAIYDRLESGEAFEKMAGLYSNAATAAKGGRLGVFSVKSLTSQVREALSGLKEQEFTQILSTEQGYQVFYVDKILGSGGKSLEEAKPEIQEKLYAERVDREFKAWLENLRERSHIEIME
jgi:peptidyl-prolyl cis-trans isomerase SurA